MPQKNNWIYGFYFVALILGLSLPKFLLGINSDSPENEIALFGFIPTLAVVGGIFMWYGDKHIGLKEWATNSRGGVFSLIFVTCFISAFISGLVATLNLGYTAEIIFFLILAITGTFLHIRDRN